VISWAARRPPMPFLLASAVCTLTGRTDDEM
jgi:hypothetical protein